MSSQERPAGGPSRRAALLRLLRYGAGAVVLLLIAFFLVRTLANNWQQIEGYQWQFDLPRLALSYVALVASYLVDVSVWRQAIVRLGQRITLPHAMRLYFTAGLGKYIPGTVWQFFGWFYLAQREGVSKLAAGTSLIITQGLSALAGALLALAAFAAGGASQPVQQLVPLLLIIPVALILLQPRLLARLMNWGLARLGRPPVALDFTFRDLLAIFIFYLLSYILWGLALFGFANSLASVSLGHFIPFLGVFPAAYALGLLAPFAPAGIGVREGVMTYLLSFFVAQPVAIVIALLARPWMIAVEIVAGGLSLLSYARSGLAIRTHEN